MTSPPAAAHDEADGGSERAGPAPAELAPGPAGALPDGEAGDPDPAGTPFQRARARAIAAGAWLACRLPEALLDRLADLAGELAYRVAARRREQARRNLGRVCRWLADAGAGSAAAQRAGRDEVALESLVRAAFRHHARYWVELARAGRMSADYIRERVVVETPEILAASVGSGGPAVFIGLHLGAIELPGFYLGRVVGRPSVGPMETVADPALQRWFLATRQAMGVRLVGLRGARRELRRVLASGGIAGIVADRDLTGGGIERILFGAPAPLPVGPALMVVETGAPAYSVAVRRTGRGRYRARLESLPEPTGRTRRERVESFLDAEARSFERLVADAPEQWWAVFHPIWPDLAVAAGVRR